MKKSILFFVFVLINVSIYSQSSNDSIQTNKTVSSTTVTTGQEIGKSPSKVAINAGILMGGGSLIGGDLEYLPSSRIGLQAGVGISSFGLALNYHLADRINSSFITLQYYHQGFGSSHFASYLGPMFVFRAKKVFQAGIGFGAVVDKGATFNLNTSFVLLYNIGVYFPL
jgi:hypothetical protein